MGNQKKKAGKSPKDAFSSYVLVPQAAKDRGSDYPGREAENVPERTHTVFSKGIGRLLPPESASSERLQRSVMWEATTQGDSEADARSGGPTPPPSTCSTMLPPEPAPEYAKGATGEIWSLTTPLGKGTSGQARLISPHDTPVPQRRHETSGRSTIAGACLRRIPRSSQAFF